MDGSYETFKRVGTRRGLKRPERRRMIRIELPPGLEDFENQKRHYGPAPHRTAAR